MFNFVYQYIFLKGNTLFLANVKVIRQSSSPQHRGESLKWAFSGYVKFISKSYFAHHIFFRNSPLMKITALPLKICILNKTTLHDMHKIRHACKSGTRNF